jgi:hypothetical protein
MSKIQVGRIVKFFAGYGGTDGVGAIVAVHGKPNPKPADESFGPAIRVVREDDCRVDVILFDGRRLNAIDQCSIDRPGIGIKLTDEVLDSVAALGPVAAKYEADQAIAKARARAAFEASEAARVITDPPVFFWNGIKDQRGAKLQGAHYSMSKMRDLPEGTITIYARGYCGFSGKVSDCFSVQNDTDTQVDYFDKDRIRVIPAHPLYPAVKAAFDAQQARYASKYGSAKTA